MNNVFIAMAIASILSQVPHAFWAINKFSQIENYWVKITQNIIFCGIISIGILVFAIQGRDFEAFLGAVIEIIINLYYFSNQFTKNHKTKTTWLAYFLAVLIPMSIWIFSREIQL